MQCCLRLTHCRCQAEAPAAAPAACSPLPTEGVSALAVQKRGREEDGQAAGGRAKRHKGSEEPYTEAARQLGC